MLRSYQFYAGGQDAKCKIDSKQKGTQKMDESKERRKTRARLDKALKKNKNRERDKYPVGYGEEKKSERHAWLRKALEREGYSAIRIAEAWGVNPAVVTRFIQTGEPKITPARVMALCKLFSMDRKELLARLGERPLPLKKLRDVPVSLIIGIAKAFNINAETALAELEGELKPVRRRTKNKDTGGTGPSSFSRRGSTKRHAVLAIDAAIANAKKKNPRSVRDIIETLEKKLDLAMALPEGER